jgi:hypothetical protein
VVGIGGSVADIAGFEGNAGGYYNTSCGAGGGFASAGVSAGVNISAEVFAGFVTAPLDGPYIGLNFNGAFFGATALLDPKTLRPIGATGSFGLGAGASTSTGTTSTRGTGGNADCDPKDPPGDPKGGSKGTAGPRGHSSGGSTGGDNGAAEGTGRMGGRK